MTFRLEDLRAREERLLAKLDAVREEIAVEQARVADAEAKRAESLARAEAERRTTDAARMERALARAERKRQRQAEIDMRMRARKREKARRTRAAEDRRRAAESARRQIVQRQWSEVIAAVSAATSTYYGTTITADAILGRVAKECLLSARYAAIWIAREKLGLTVTETADMMGRSPASISQRMARPMLMAEAGIVHGALKHMAESKHRLDSTG